MFYVLLGLAAFGLVLMLFTSFQEFLQNALFLGLALLVIWGFYHFVIRKGNRPFFRTRAASRNYRKALSRNRYRPAANPSKAVKNKKETTRAKTKRKHHLTVIEGNKGKRKI